VITLFLHFLQNLRISGRLYFMPRPTPPERMRNPIRQLREILAVYGKPLSQAELAPIVDVPVDSVRYIEKGKMVFTERQQNRIRCATGACWNDADQLWRFWVKDGPRYSREHYVKFRELLGQEMEGAMARLDVFFATLRVKLLLEALPPKARFKFLFRLNSFLEKNRKEFCPERFAELFADASGFIEAHPEIDREHPLRVSRGYPGRLIGHTIVAKSDTAPAPGKFNPTNFDLVAYEKHIRQARAKSGGSKTTRGPRRA
jgi:hypothetical protein